MYVVSTPCHRDKVKPGIADNHGPPVGVRLNLPASEVRTWLRSPITPANTMTSMDKESAASGISSNIVGHYVAAGLYYAARRTEAGYRRYD